MLSLALSIAVHAPAAGGRADDAAVPDDASEAEGGAETDAGTEPRYESEVRATRPPRTASERRVEGTAIETAPRRSAEDLLRLVPGLLAVRHGAEGKGRQIFLRGFDAAHGSDVEALVDGFPVNDVSNPHGHGYLDLHFLPPEVVESIDVLKGPFDLRQADFATAGSLRLRPGVPERARGSAASYEWGMTWRRRVAVVHAPAGWGDGFIATEAVQDDGYGSNRWTRRLAAVGRVDFDPDGSGPELLAAAHAGRFGSPTAVRAEDHAAGRIGFLDGYVHGLSGLSERLLAVATHRLEAGDGTLRLVGGASLRRFAVETNYTGWLDRPGGGDFRRQRHEAATGFASAWWDRPLGLLGRPATLTAGLEWRGDWILQDEGRIDAPSRRLSLALADAAADVHRTTAAAGLSWSIAPWFQADVGVRVDMIAIGYEDILDGGREHDDLLAAASPRVALRFPTGDAWTFFLAYGRGFRAPEARSAAAAAAPDEDVELSRYRGGRPEIAAADAVEAGARFSPAPWLEVSAVAFATFIGSESVFDHVSGTSIEVNPTRRIGGEASVAIRPLRWLDLRLDVSGVDARFSGSGNPVPGVPPLLASLGAHAVHRWGFFGALTAFCIAPRPLAHGAVGTWQAAIDLTAGFRWRRLEARIEIENLLDSELREGEYHFASWFDRDEPRSVIPVTHYAAGPPLGVRAALTLRL